MPDCVVVYAFGATHRILAPSLYIFFASSLPGLAFGQQLAEETEGTLTVVHVLTATAIAGVVQVCAFSVLCMGSQQQQHMMHSAAFCFTLSTLQEGETTSLTIAKEAFIKEDLQGFSYIWE